MAKVPNDESIYNSLLEVKNRYNGSIHYSKNNGVACVLIEDCLLSVIYDPSNAGLIYGGIIVSVPMDIDEEFVLKKSRKLKLVDEFKYDQFSRDRSNKEFDIYYKDNQGLNMVNSLLKSIELKRFLNDLNHHIEIALCDHCLTIQYNKEFMEETFTQKQANLIIEMIKEIKLQIDYYIKRGF